MLSTRWNRLGNGRGDARSQRIDVEAFSHRRRYSRRRLDVAEPRARGAGTTESDYLNGETTLLGRLHGVATPVNTALQHLSARMAREGLPPGSVDPAELEVLINV